MNRAFLLLLLFACSTSAVVAAIPQGTAFTYQGRLEQSGAPAAGNFDFAFKLFDALSGGTQIGATVTKSAVAVDQGGFPVVLDFGIVAFDGNTRFIQVQVGTTTLLPRTQITS